MKLAPEVGLGKIFQMPKWLCFLTLSSKDSGGYHFKPSDHGKSCSKGAKFRIAYKHTNKPY